MADFTLTANPDSVDLTPDDTATTTITALPINGSKDIDPWVIHLPVDSGLSADMPEGIPASTSAIRSLHITADPDTLPGHYTVTVEATVGAISHHVDIDVNVTTNDSAQDPASMTVNTTDDHEDDSGCTVNDCTLREAIAAANGSSGDSTRTIEFGLGDATPTIQLHGALPSINVPVSIDGGASVEAGCQIPNNPVTLDGTGNENQPNGLTFVVGSEGSTVQGLRITGWGGPGVLATYSAAVLSNLVIQCNVIDHNGGFGVDLVDTSGALVGAATDHGNQIHDNAQGGIRVRKSGVANPFGDRLDANLIYDNGGLAIDIGGDGATANDPGDTDTGVNGLSNHPVLYNAEHRPDGTGIINGTSTRSPVRSGSRSMRARSATRRTTATAHRSSGPSMSSRTRT